MGERAARLERYDDDVARQQAVFRDEARAVFERTVVPRDFDAIAIPFPERGEPTLMRHEEPVAG